MITISEEEYVQLKEDYGGICIACGEQIFGGIEPDARGYICECCGEPKVYGVEELLIMGEISFS